MANFSSRQIPTSFLEALQLCKDYAKSKHNISVERIADEMGISASRLYQLLDSGDMPLSKVRNFQRICKCNFVTQYLAHGDNCLLVDIPTGKKLTESDLMNMQLSFHECMTKLAKFYKDFDNPQEAAEAITKHMTDAAWHHENIAKQQQPGLDFESETE